MASNHLAARHPLVTLFVVGYLRASWRDFGQGPIEFPGEPEQYLEGYVDMDGNVAFPGGQFLDATKLYEAFYGYLKGERKAGPGILGPITKYMKNGDC